MKCPGQDTRYWDQEAIFDARCPNCGAEMEFFKDDASRPCPRCGSKVPNPRMDFGCAAYCPYAEQCLGSLTPELKEKQAESLRNRVAQRIKGILVPDFSLVGRISNLVHAVEIRAKEEGLDLPALLIAAHVALVPDKAAEKEGCGSRNELVRKLVPNEELARDAINILEAIDEPDSGDPRAEILRSALSALINDSLIT